MTSLQSCFRNEHLSVYTIANMIGNKFIAISKQLILIFDVIVLVVLLICVWSWVSSFFFVRKMENTTECCLAAATVIICGCELFLMDEEEEPKRKKQRTKWVRELFAWQSVSSRPIAWLTISHAAAREYLFLKLALSTFQRHSWVSTSSINVRVASFCHGETCLRPFTFFFFAFQIPLGILPFLCNDNILVEIKRNNCRRLPQYFLLQINCEYLIAVHLHYKRNQHFQ